MKPLFGGKLGRFYLRSTIWIAASHMRECGIRLGGEHESGNHGGCEQRGRGDIPWDPCGT